MLPHSASLRVPFLFISAIHSCPTLFEFNGIPPAFLADLSPLYLFCQFGDRAEPCLIAVCAVVSTLTTTVSTRLPVPPMHPLPRLRSGPNARPSSMAVAAVVLLLLLPTRLP